MAKFDPKAEVSPAVAAIVIIVVIAIAAGLVFYFMNRETGPSPGMPVGPDQPIPGAVPQGPMPGMPPAGPGSAPLGPPPPPPQPPPGG